MEETLKILLVDDEDHLQEVLGLLLELDGHQVTTAFSGEQALERAKEGKFDLVITDFKMPGMNGMDVVRSIKKENPDTAVVMITGYPTEDTEKEAQKLGVDDYIAKPFHMDKMREVIRRVSYKVK